MCLFCQLVIVSQRNDDNLDLLVDILISWQDYEEIFQFLGEFITGFRDFDISMRMLMAKNSPRFWARSWQLFFF